MHPFLPYPTIFRSAAIARFPTAGWANDLVGAGRALDPARHRILAFDYVGADGTLDALIDTGDQADAVAGLLDAIDIDALHALVVDSSGARVGLQLRAEERGVGTEVVSNDIYRG